MVHAKRPSAVSVHQPQWNMKRSCKLAGTLTSSLAHIGCQGALVGVALTLAAQWDQEWLWCGGGDGREGQGDVSDTILCSAQAHLILFPVLGGGGGRGEVGHKAVHSVSQCHKF